MTVQERLSPTELLELQRWNTPTIYNGWEQISRRDPAADAFNLEPVQDFMPHMGPIAGYAVTMVIEPSNPRHKKAAPGAFFDYLRYMADVPDPKILVVQDLDKPRMVGCCAGEVFTNIHRSLGCVGAIIDGGARDLDEMNTVGFKVLARQLGVGHGHAHPVRWNCDVEAFGRTIRPGQLIHADKHGFMAIEPEEEKPLLEAARFMDSNECAHVIPTARYTAGLSREELIERFAAAAQAFGQCAKQRFGNKGEW